MTKIKRNELCPCGSGVKYKKCCGSGIKAKESVPNQESETVPFEVAMKRFHTPPDVFNALLSSGLLGDYTEEGIPKIGIEHFERFGTQWRPELGERLAPDQDITFPQGVAGGHQPPNTYTRIQVSHYDSPDVADQDTSWIAQFYLKPNRYFYPDPGALALIGPLYLKIPERRQVLGTRFPAFLYPDTSGSLSMAMVSGSGKLEDNPMEIAYDVVVPVLDELAIQYDQPLPIAHSLIVGIPSGIISIDVSRHPKVRRILSSDQILARCPYPELLDAVALYREAISSNNPFHQFLTLWKVYENATRIRGDWRKQNRSKDVKVHQEVFPDLFAFGDFKGQTFEKVKQSLNDAYRNAIAHGDISRGRPKTAALSTDYVDVWMHVPVLRYMAHIVLENVRATLGSTSS